jgi:hypothetical protein
VTELVDLALPCRLIALNVQLGPQRGVTTLEDLVAKAVLAGRSSMEAQAGLFGMPRRILLDVVHSLWGKGYMIVDLESGLLALSETAREILVGGGTLQDAAAETQERHFLFEPITGRILPQGDGTQRPREASLRVPLDHGIAETDLPEDELLRAVQAAIRSDRQQGFRKNVLGVSFGNPVLRPPALLRWVPASATVRTDPDTGRLEVILTDSRRWDARARAKIREHLAELADVEPDHPFVQGLRARTDDQLERPESAVTLLTKMSGLLGGLPGIPAGRVAQRQQDLATLSHQIEDRLAALDRSRAAVTVVTRTSGQLWAVEDLISSARSQLVIVSPHISYRALNPLLPTLRAAFDKKVQVVVLWGRTYADSLPKNVMAAFDELAALYRPNLIVADRSARTEACVVIQDAARALVCSQSPFVADPARDADSLSVLVEPAERGPSSPEVVTDMLAWARRTYPYTQEGQRIRIGGDSPGEVPAQAAADLPVAGDAPDESAVRLWAASWAEHHAAMADAVHRGDVIGPVVNLITDGDHQDVFWGMLREKSRRLVVVDDVVDSGLVDRLLPVLREGARAGTAVDLVCPLPQPGAVVSAALAELGEQPVEGIRLRRQRAGVRLVLTDDEAVVGSFSPLSDDGRHLVRSSDRRSQLGLHIQGRSIASELAAALPVSAVSPAGPEPPDLPARTRSAATAALPLLVEARREWDRGRFGAFVADRLAQLDDPAAVLDKWRSDAAVPADELRPAAAALLRLQAGRDLNDLAPWISWLLTDAWERLQFVVAALIAGLARDLPVTPSTAACLAAAAVEHGPLGDALTYPALELSEDTTPAKTAGGAGALAELMLWGSGEGEEALGLLGASLPPSWQELASAALKFYGATGAPVPVELLEAEVSRSADAADIEARWADLAARIDKLERLRQRFNFDSGVAMHAGLFTPNGLLTAIRAAAAEPARRSTLVADLPADLRQHLNNLVAAAGQPPVQWHRQQHFLDDVTGIVRAARALAPQQVLAVESAAVVAASPACRELGHLAAGSRDELLADVNALERPYQLPLRGLLYRLDPLVRWGRS